MLDAIRQEITLLLQEILDTNTQHSIPSRAEYFAEDEAGPPVFDRRLANPIFIHSFNKVWKMFIGDDISAKLSVCEYNSNGERLRKEYPRGVK